MLRAPLKSIALVVVAGFALSACSAVDRLEHIGEAPALSPITDPTALPNYRPISMPMPPKQPPDTYLTNSLWPVGSHSFFPDPRASHVGDLVTVDISIADAAKLSDSTQRARTNADTAGIGNLFGLQGQLAQVTGADPSKLVNMNSTTSNQGSGSIARSETINLTLAAVVTQVLPNGNLVIQGNQQVRVNDELRNLQISGIVRTEDITSNNTINLSQIADARLSYGGRGQITDVQQPPLGQQLYDILMPF
ncbi:MAG: flagellar basal body L-ring protein FlgH [Rhizomicrobium sp.]